MGTAKMSMLMTCLRRIYRKPALVRPVLAAALPPALKTAAQTLDASPLHLLRCPSKAVIDARR
jgi:hypothetical protein